MRDRPEDLGRLLVKFLRQELERVGELERLDQDPPWLPAEMVARLMGHQWPGNVRQLRNVIRQLVITHRGYDQLRADALDDCFEETSASSEPLAAASQVRQIAALKPADISEEELISALRAQRWRPYAAARQLGIPRPSIYHLIRRSPRVRAAADLALDEIVPARQRFGDDIASMAAELEVSERALRRRLRQLGLL